MKKHIWLSTNGKAYFYNDHLEGADEHLDGEKFDRDELVNFYNKMFDKGFLRVVIDGYDLFFNYSRDGQRPSRKQIQWLKDFSIENQYVPMDGNINRELSLEENEDLEYDKIIEENLGKVFDNKIKSYFKQNPANREFEERMKG